MKPRQNIAIKRQSLSRPVTLAMEGAFIHRGGSYFDYGQGRGDDVRILKRRGVLAHGWDPHYAPSRKKTRADAVGLVYVLNVISDSAERRRTLLDAARLAKRWLLVAVRVDQVEGTPYRDGVLTSSGSYQRNYTPVGFRSMVWRVLGREPYELAPGVLIVPMKKRR